MRAGLEAVVSIVLPRIAAAGEVVTVRASAFVAPEEIKNSAFVVDPAEITSGAGSLQDVSRYLQTLPGVVLGTNDFRNDIIVRGGSPLENLFIVDNIEIPNINAFANFTSAGGTVSLLDTYRIDDVTFLTGGYPAPYINRVSSVLQIAQREGSRDRLAGRATVGFAGAGGIVEGPIKGGRGSWVVSVRRSFIDLVTDDIGGAGGVPVLYTLNARIVYDVSPSDRIWAANITGVDRIRLDLTDTSDLADEISDFDIRSRGWRAATGFNWQRIFGQRGVGLLGVSHSTARLTTTVKDLIRDGIPPADEPVDEVIAQGEVYRKTYDDYPVSTTFPALSLANIGDTFNVRDVLFPMSSDGFGRAQGVEFSAERKPGGRWYGQLNLAWSSARHAGLDGVLRPGSFESPIVANLDGAVDLTDRWRLSARFAFLSGRPATPFDEAVSVVQRLGIYDLERVNAVRAPAYARLDVRVERRSVVVGQPLVVFGGVQNVTNRRNVARYTWNRRLNQASVQDQNGVFPILGLDWRF